MRIQTIAHECIHSIQSKRMLWFNFLFSNVYFLYFLMSCIWILVKGNQGASVLFGVLFLFGSVQYAIRSMLETDAMIKARYVAKEYMQKQGILTDKEIDKFTTQYDKMNEIGVKLVNYDNLVKN